MAHGSLSHKGRVPSLQYVVPVLSHTVTVSTVVVLLTLTVVLFLSACGATAVNDDPPVTSAPVLYFIPRDQSRLHPEVSVEVATRLGLEGYTPVDLRPQTLKDFNIVDIEPTTGWDTVVERALQGQLKAVIIHADARSTMTRADLDSL